jgi:hypothetical protein
MCYRVVWPGMYCSTRRRRTSSTKLPTREKVAVDNVMEKLRELGPSLPPPHSSNVQTADNLRELRPRQGRCAWRAFYREITPTFVVAAIGPEAQQDPKGFYKAVRLAEQRLDELEDDE